VGVSSGTIVAVSRKTAGLTAFCCLGLVGFLGFTGVWAYTKPHISSRHGKNLKAASFIHRVRNVKL
jgi:hypothetical protein